MKKICGILLVLTLTTSSFYATPADAFDWGNFGNKILRSVGISNGGHSSKPKIAKKIKLSLVNLTRRYWQIIACTKLLICVLGIKKLNYMQIV